MHWLGVSGVRINLFFGARAALKTARRLAPRLRETGWHIQLLFDLSTIDGSEWHLTELQMATVFNHFGHLSAPPAASDPGFMVLVALVREGRSSGELSDAYKITAEKHESYGNVASLARALIDDNPDRVLWKTDWPHPAAIWVSVPDDAVLAGMALEWVTEPALRRKLFVCNAEELYGFESMSAEPSSTDVQK